MLFAPLGLGAVDEDFDVALEPPALGDHVLFVSAGNFDLTFIGPDVGELPAGAAARERTARSGETRCQRPGLDSLA